MLAEEVLVKQLLLHRRNLLLRQIFRMPGHHSELFQYYAVVNRLHAVLAPGKGTVGFYQHGGNVIGILTLKVSTMTLPVSFSYSPPISSGVIARVQGMEP